MEKSYEGVHSFYVDRINRAMSGNFQQRMDWLAMIGRVAMMDSFLTMDEYTDILNRLNKAHQKAMEDNYNAGWNV